MSRTLARTRSAVRTSRHVPALLLVVLASTACGPLTPVMQAAGLAPTAPVLGVEQVEEAVQDQYDATNPKLPAMAVECKARQADYLCGIQDSWSQAVSLLVLAKAEGEQVTVERVDEVAFLKQGDPLAERAIKLSDRETAFDMRLDESIVESLEYELELEDRDAVLNGREEELRLTQREKDLEKQEKAVK